MSNLRHSLRPMAGKIAVVREHIDSHWSKELGIAKTIETEEDEKRINPFAFVVGVGGPKTTERGSLIETPIVKGDRILIAQIGQSIFLKDGEGSGDWVYILPFEGVLGRLEWDCTQCDYTTTREAETCPVCPGNVIMAPTLLDIVAAKRGGPH